MVSASINFKLDIFIASLNSTHCVCQKGFHLAIISTKVETENPISELKPAFDIIGTVLEQFVTITDEFEPVEDKFEDNVIITKSFTSVSHFEFDTKDVLALYKRLAGKELDLENLEDTD